MAWDRESLLQFLDSRGIAYREATHAAVYTMGESAALAPSLDGVRCKNLLVQSRKSADRLLVVTAPDAMVELGALGRSLGIGRLSFCSPSEMTDLLGVEPGAMSPLALVADQDARKVRLLVDLALKQAPRFLFHPLVNTATVSIDSEGFLRFLAAIGHPAEFVAVPRRAVPLDLAQ